MMDIICRGYVATLLYNSDVRVQKWEAKCKALGYEDSDYSSQALESRFIEFVKQKIDKNGK